MPDFDFAPAPNEEASALIAGKTPVAKKVFTALLPELRARAFTVAGIEGMNALQRIRDQVTSVPLGNQTWDQAKKQIVDELEPALGDAADYRATLVLRTNGFQAFSTTIHNAGMADEDTTHFQYLHGECKVPTPSHLALNGIILPKDDPFWETHTGPWGHLGCVCYKRPMNPDFVDDEKEKDKKRNPDDRLVIKGPALKQLRHGDILRGGVHYNVNIDGPDNSGFSWHPGDFKIPLKDLEKKYDPEVWSEFQQWGQTTKLSENQSVWDWLNSSDRAIIPPTKANEPGPSTEVGGRDSGGDAGAAVAAAVDGGAGAGAAGSRAIGEPVHAGIAAAAKRQQAAITGLFETGQFNLEPHPERALKGGEEHIVELSEDGQRVIKHTRGENFGVTINAKEAPLGSFLNLRQATAGCLVESRSDEGFLIVRAKVWAIFTDLEMRKVK